MKTGILLMAYGAPERLEDVEPFLRRILARRPPSPETLEEFVERYRRIGGGSPLPRIARALAASLEDRLRVPVFLGMLHTPPFIAETVSRARREGIDRLVGLTLAPHFNRASIEPCHEELRKTDVSCVLVESWHREPALLEYWKGVTRGRDFVLYTAHSVPLGKAGPYPDQVAEMVSAIAGGPHRLAYQSQSGGPDPWLGPSIGDVLPSLPKDVSVAPVGFVTDNLEILYDLDVLHRGEAEARGIRWERLPMPNDHPLLVEALASAAGRHL